MSAKPIRRFTPSSAACPVGHIRLNVIYTCAEEFNLRASNGYRLTVFAEAPDGGGTAAQRHEPVEVEVSGSHASVNYLGHGTVGPDRIHASFGQLGVISVRFRPSGRHRRVKIPKRCLRHRPPVVFARLGTFVGTIRFRGERGYTKVVARRAQGGIGDPLAISTKKLQCEEPTRPSESQDLLLSASEPHGAIGFSAFAEAGQPAASASSTLLPRGYERFFLASAVEGNRTLMILRFVGTRGPAADFTSDASLDSATITPPAPFSGTATFQRNPDGSTSWTGSLSVSMPGLGRVSLASSRFTAKFNTVQKRLEEPIAK